jgi:ArsR family transcriptional regulator, lead/cadmium/zinc/bismuth-responsive transcriptional repressor
MEGTTHRRSDSAVCNVTCFEQKKVAEVKATLAGETRQVPELVKLYKLLGSETRLKILFTLAQGELCVCDISHVLELSVAATSHQLKRLREQGWLRMRNDGKMVYYELNGRGLLKALRDDLTLLEARLG